MMKIARVLAGSGVLLLCASVAFAQAPEKPSEAAPQDQAPAAQPARPAGEPKAAPVRRPAPRTTAATPECAWTGKRIVSLLIRDDADTAEKFRRFYDMFHCPADHLGPAMRCVVLSDGAAQSKALADRVDQCWDKPSVRFLNNR